MEKLIIKEILSLKVDIPGIDCSKESWRGFNPYPVEYFQDEFGVVSYTK